MEKRLLRIPEVVESTGLSRSEIYRAIDRHELVVVKFGRAIRVTPDDVDAFIRHKREESLSPIPVLA